jgi:hypothetical protein
MIVAKLASRKPSFRYYPLLGFPVGTHSWFGPEKWKPELQIVVGLECAIAGAAITTNNIAITAATARTRMVRFKAPPTFPVVLCPIITTSRSVEGTE